VADKWLLIETFGGEGREPSVIAVGRTHQCSRGRVGVTGAFGLQVVGQRRARRDPRNTLRVVRLLARTPTSRAFLTRRSSPGVFGQSWARSAPTSSGAAQPGPEQQVHDRAVPVLAGAGA
jgi:hypothetical protein